MCVSEREMDRENGCPIRTERERERRREDANVVHTPPKYNKEPNKKSPILTVRVLLQVRHRAFHCGINRFKELFYDLLKMRTN